VRKRKVGAVAVLSVVTAMTVVGEAAHAFPSGGALPPPLTLVVPITASTDVPVDARGVALNVTVTNPAAAGYLTVYPCGDRPLASNLNYVANQTVPNFVVTALSPDGEVCIDTIAVVDIVVDLAGYLPNTSPIVTLDQPLRIVDSREGKGLAAPMRSADVAAVQVGGVGGIPSDAAMVLFNATAVNTGGPGFLTVFPCGEAVPPTSTLNFTANAIVPNFVLARIGAAGQVCVYSIAATDVVIDVAGYVPQGAADIVALQQPDRLLDTRYGVGGPIAKLTPAGRVLQLTGVDGIPDTATAVVVNLTATQAGVSGYVTAFPCGGSAPLVSNLNFTPNAIVANMAIVKLSAGGQVCFVSNTDVDVIADVTAYLTADTSITALPPTRVYDSREGVDPHCNIGVQEIHDGFQVLDLTSGAPLGTLPLNNALFPRVYVRGDCQTIDVVGSLSVPAQDWWWQYSPSGSLLGAQQLPAFSAGLMFTDAGPLIIQHSPTGPVYLPPVPPWQIIDGTTGKALFTLPEPGPASDGSYRPWRPLGATVDGSIIALQTDSVDRTAKVVSYWTPDGLLLGQWASPAGALDIQISKLGSYLSYVMSTGTNTFDEFVVTLTGAAVADLPGGLWWNDEWHDVWMSDGAIMGCIIRVNLPQQRAARWDLFSPMKAVVQGDPNHLCLTAAG
jgi:hypothetical protein